MRRCLVTLVLSLAVVSTQAQTVSQWRTSNGLPLVIVQLPGGDLEHLAVVVPTGTRLVEQVGDRPLQITPRRLAQILTVRAGELQLAAVVSELLEALRETGAAAVVAVGPRPPRDLAQLLEGSENVPWHPLPRQRCPLIDGGIEALSGSPERVELAFGLPEMTDLRLSVAPALALLIELAVRSHVPGVRAGLDLSTGCARLVVRAPAEQVPPRVLLRTLRSELVALADRDPASSEMEGVRIASAARAGRLAVDAAGAAREVAEWVALGGVPAAVLATAEVEISALTSLAREVLSGHSGWGTVVEAEQRGRPPGRESLDNGALLSVAWVPGDLTVLAVALGGFAPRTGGEVLDRCAAAAAGQGWFTHRSEILGVPVVAVAVPAETTNEALELLVGSLQTVEPPSDDLLWAEVVRTLGFAVRPEAETVSLAAMLPLDAETGAEAARKFLAGLGTGSIRVELPAVDRQLRWTPSEGRPRLIALSEIEASPAGVLAAVLLQNRATGAGLELHLLAPPGRLTLGLVGAGEPHVPALDARLAGVWPRLVRPVDGPELRAALARVETLVLGDMAQAAARVAAQPFLPCSLDERALRTVTAGDINRVLGTLPSWTGLLRVAHGPAPTAEKGVRQSAPGAPAAR